MKETPILFSAPMVRALLAGTKTITRRIVKHEPTPIPSGTRIVRLRGTNSYITLHDDFGLVWNPYSGSGTMPWPIARIGEACPYGGIGDRLWVKETFQPTWAPGRDRAPGSMKEPDGWALSYVATAGVIEYHDPDDGLVSRCKPAIFMPRWASRITLEVVSVRVERLHEITEDDAKAEGVRPFLEVYSSFAADQRIDGDRVDEKPFRTSFVCLWDEINGDHALFSSNSWVWRVEFRRVEQQT